MGGGVYCYASAQNRIETKEYSTKSTQEVFKSRTINNAMNPHGITLRESRDSEEHPNSFPIVLALDETGSMGSIPHYLVKKGLPDIMDRIIKGGIKDPQVLFMGIGDHECDEAPLQVGQFESSDALLDKWLTSLFLEGNGGGNDGESYLLAWFFAGRYTTTDHYEKRQKKGILITIGDEPTLNELPANAQNEIMGPGQYTTMTAAELLSKAREKYEVFHLHMLEGVNGNRKSVQDGWKQLMGDHVIYVDNKEKVPQVIADIVLKNQSSLVSEEEKETKGKEEKKVML